MQLSEQILNILGEADGNVSGEQLAKSLFVSRNAVWKAINELRGRGFIIEAVTNRGYCLSKDNVRLCASQIKKFTHTDINITVFDSLNSTNAVAKQLGEQGAAEGTVIVSLQQTGGRGRLGRSFFSPDGGLYFSVLLRPEFNPQISLLATTAAAVAVAGAAEEISGKECGIKWVNDIYSEDRKICGILTEGSFNAETGRLDYAVLGIGINICTPTDGFPQEIRDRAGSLFGHKIVGSETRAELTGKIIDRFFSFYRNIEAKEFMKEYQSRSILTGKKIEYLSGGYTHNAIVHGIDDDAHLIVEENGQICTIGAGDISVKF